MPFHDHLWALSCPTGPTHSSNGDMKLILSNPQLGDSALLGGLLALRGGDDRCLSNRSGV